MRLYHGSNHVIDEFSDEFVDGEKTASYGPGIYFTTSIEQAELFGKIIYEVELAPRKLLNNIKNVGEVVMALARKSEGYELKILDWDENKSAAERKLIEGFRGMKIDQIFNSIWFDFYRYDTKNYLRNMVAMGIDAKRVKFNDEIYNYVVFNPKCIKVKNVINEHKMCGTNKKCSCGCAVKKLNESRISKISDDILQVEGNVDNGVQNAEDVDNPFVSFDIEKFKDGSVSICVNEDPNQTYHFDSLNDMIIFMGNDAEVTMGSKHPKKLFFNKNVLGAISEFVGEPRHQMVEAKDSKYMKKITIQAADPDNTIFKMLDTIRQLGNGGHGFDIKVDEDLKPENDEAGIKTEFYWDGDGPDKIVDISVESMDETDSDYYKDQSKALEKNGEQHGADIMAGKAEAEEQGLLKDGEIITEAEDKESKQLYKMLCKYHDKKHAFDKKLNGKFAGFTSSETKEHREIETLKNDAWEFARRKNIDTNAVMALDKKAMNAAKGLTEAVKVNMKLSSNTKRELIKKAKTALDAIYLMYDICEKQGITSRSFVKNLDMAFEGANEMLTILVTQESTEKK